jgi:hypothetical protein
MPHDLSRSSANSASSSALTYTPPNSSSNNNHYYHKNTKNNDKMDVSENEEEETTTDDLTKQQKKLKQNKYSIVHADMIFYCFEILGNHLFNGKNHLGKHHSSNNLPISSSPSLPPALPNDPYPLFVTWFIGSEQKLRGCIGTFTPMNLAQGRSIKSIYLEFPFFFRSSRIRINISNK